MEECLFCKIVKGEVNSKTVYENDYVLAFNDINPIAPIHVLIVPKIHIQDLNSIDTNNLKYVEEIMLAIKEVARITGVVESGYRVVSNVGEDGGQVVPHLHFHLLGGKSL